MLALRISQRASALAPLLFVLAAAVALAEEPPGEAVPLPAERPATPAQKNSETPVSTTKTPDDDAPLLTADTPEIHAGQKATFSLYGPETFLRGAIGRFAVHDEFNRQLGKGMINIGDLPYSEGKPRQIQLQLEHPLGRQYVLDFSISRPEDKTIELSVPFTVLPAPETASQTAAKWDGWINLVSTPPPDGDWDVLHALGVSGAVQYRLHPARREALRKGQALFYVENVSRQMLSRYHTEPGLWDKTLAGMIADPSARVARFRDPSLCSQEFAETFARELQREAGAYAKDPPLFYSLASEPSVTRLAAPADFDFSPAALAEFQRWLERDVYGTLPALNAAWVTQFATWTDVAPMTTDEARQRLSDGIMSFGPWVDFRAFQDRTFARILREGGDYLRKTDPQAKAGITGAMGAFAFGGWDWSQLAPALDVVEAYDIGSARALWRDLAPGKPALAIVPVPPDDKPERLAEVTRTLWNLALECGPRGAVFWNDDATLTPPAPVPAPGDAKAPAPPDANGIPGPVAAALAPILNTLKGDTGAFLAHCKPVRDGVALLYSPASIRMTWLLEAERLHGANWLDAWGRDTTAERRESPQLRLRESWCKLLDDAGLGWRFVSSAQIEKREILNKDAGIKIIVLPRTLCISDIEADILKQFVQGGGKLIADACCGRFDEHGRLRKKPALDEIFGIDSTVEPFFAEPMNPLEPVKALKDYPIEGLDDVAPVFSDKVKSDGNFLFRADYRGAPVLKATGAGAFLNLDLTDYLRWRLHPERPRARATLNVLIGLLKQPRDASALDWQATQLPSGTRVIQSVFGAGEQATHVVALMRNPQARLHELGADGDGNWMFEKPEHFVLGLRQPAYIRRIFPALEEKDIDAAVAGKPSSTVEGSLDSASPVIFAIQSTPAKAPALSATEKIKPGELIEIKITPEANASPGLFVFTVKGPDGVARPYYGKSLFSADGSAAYSFPTALNDAPGAWTISARNTVTGAEAVRTFTIQEAEPKP